MLSMKKRQTYKSYISYVDWSVVCVYPLLRSHVVERSCGGNKNKIVYTGFAVKLQHEDCTVYTVHSMWNEHHDYFRQNIFCASSFGSTHFRIWLPLWLPSLFWGGTEREEGEGEKREEMQKKKKNHHRQQGGPFWFPGTRCFVSLGSDEAHGTQVLARWWRMWLPLTCLEAAILHTWLRICRWGLPNA